MRTRLDGDLRPPTPPRRMGVRVVGSLVVVLIVFAFALPRIADYGDAWATLARLGTSQAALLVVVAIIHLCAYWPVLVVALPGLRLGQAAVVHEVSTAVAHTVPAGGAVAVGVAVRMLRTWGFSTTSITNQVVVTGVWNSLVKLGLPVLAVAVVVVTGELDGTALRLAGWGAGLLICAVVAGTIALRAESTALRLGRLADQAANPVLRRVGRGPADVGAWLARLRAELVELVGRSGARLSLAVLASHVTLYLVLLVCLRGVGVGQDALSWPAILLAFALVRLLSALPITPGGVGLVELGYIGFLSASAAGVDAEVTAAILLFRAITFVLPILLGGVAWAVYQTVDGWRQPVRSDAAAAHTAAAHTAAEVLSR